MSRLAACRQWGGRLLRDPVLTIANTVLALAVAWSVLALAGGALVSLFDPVEGYWHGVYCAVGHMTTHGCDVEPTAGPGRGTSAGLQVAGVIVTAAVVAHAIGSLIHDAVEAWQTAVLARLARHLGVDLSDLDEPESLR